MIPLCLPDILQQSRERDPTKIALVCHNKRFTYEELHARATEVAATLHDLGLRKGQAVLISMVNSAEFVVAFFGIAAAGGVVVPVSSELSLREFQYIVGHCEAKALVTTGDNRKLLREILPQLDASPAVVVLDNDPPGVLGGLGGETPRTVRLRFPQVRARQNPESRALRLIDADEALIIYTSGTAGPPKGVLLTHLNMMSSVRSVVDYLRLTADDTGLIGLPLFHVYALSQLLTHLSCGGTIVLVENFAFPTHVLRLVERERVSGLGGTPAAFNLLLNVKDLGNYQLDSLRYLLSSGGPLPRLTLQQLMEAFPQAEIISAYGLTEASSRVSHCAYRKGSTRPLGSVGRPMPNVEVRVVNAAGDEVKPGEVGEIVIRGSTVMKGYFRDAAATAQVLQPDGLHTGDFATIDAEGCLFIVGRRDDILNSGGESISAREVEDVLLSHPAVLEAAVVGKPDEVLGDALQAFLVLRPGVAVSEDDVKEHCLQHLSRYKVPREFIVCEALPKSPAGKVQKRILREGVVKRRIS